MSIHAVLREILSLDKLTIPKPSKLILPLPDGFPRPLEVDPANVYEAFGPLVEDHWRHLANSMLTPLSTRGE